MSERKEFLKKVGEDIKAELQAFKKQVKDNPLMGFLLLDEMFEEHFEKHISIMLRNKWIEGYQFAMQLQKAPAIPEGYLEKQPDWYHNEAKKQYFKPSENKYYKFACDEYHQCSHPRCTYEVTEAGEHVKQD